MPKKANSIQSRARVAFLKTHTPSSARVSRVANCTLVILELYCDNGKETGNYNILLRFIVDLHWGNGKENGNYNIIIGFILELHWGNGKENG